MARLINDPTFNLDTIQIYQQQYEPNMFHLR